MNGLKRGVNDLPEIAMINREIERFKTTMIRNLTLADEESARAVAERHILNGLEIARDVLLRSYYENRRLRHQNSSIIAKERKKRDSPR